MDNLKKLLPEVNWRQEKPAEPEVIQVLLSKSKLNLPEEYLQFLRYSNGGEGELSIAPGWFQLWPAEEVIENNEGYEVGKWIPGFFGFGGNGGGELFVFNTRTPPWRIYRIPFIPMEEKEAVLVAESFTDFIKSIGRILSE